jgi:hypothetical protein
MWKSAITSRICETLFAIPGQSEFIGAPQKKIKNVEITLKTAKLNEN